MDLKDKPTTPDEAIAAATEAINALGVALAPTMAALAAAFRNIHAMLDKYHIRSLAAGYRIENKRGRNKLVAIKKGIKK